MADGVTFTPDSAKRIAKVVKKVEAEPQRMGGANQPTIQPNTQFWARITGIHYTPFDGVSSDQPPPQYSWIRMTPDAKSASGFKVHTPVISGILSARESSGSPYVERDTVVLMTFIGCDDDQVPVYVFTHPGRQPDNQGVPVHDHRDNLSGGFAFACMHPGSALPQQRWQL